MSDTWDINIPYVGSFQRGLRFRSGDPLTAVWRQIEKIGTIDNLTRIVIQKQREASTARVASLRIRQAVELRQASRGTSALTRPLLLYYSTLNLVRGILLTFLGDIGGPSHGLRYEAARNLLDCGAKIAKTGTFRCFVEKALGIPSAKLDNKKFTLRDMFSLMPELISDFNLLQSGPSSIVPVSVEAIIDGETTLKYRIAGISEVEFRAQWTSLLPWLSDICEVTEQPFTLKVKNHLKDDAEISDFCRKHFFHDLNWRDDALWFDHVVRNEALLLSRMPAYLAVLFILSNVSRYEPEILDNATREPTDVAYVINTFLDCAERYFPQLILERLYGKAVFFS